MRRQLALWVTALVLLALPASARAFVVQDFAGFISGTNGIALGADGNYWIVEENTNSVARMTPAGDVIGRVQVAGTPTSAAPGPDATVWVTVTGANQLAKINTRTGGVTPVPLPVGCGPVAIVDGGNGRMYFTQPCFDNVSQSFIGSVPAVGNDPRRTPISGQVVDLAVHGGKLFAPELNNDVVRRFTLAAAPAVEGTISAFGAPDGVTVDGAGSVWVTLNGTGGVARFPSGQVGGNAELIAPVGGRLSEPFGIVAAGDGNVYVAGKASRNIARISPDGKWKFFPVGGDPFDIAKGLDGDVYFTDRTSTRVRRLISSAPRVAGGAGAATATTSANVSATVDARGNPTTVTFEYGPTPAYGSAVTVAANGVGPFPVGATLTGLAPGTTYHVRVRAINEEGEAVPGPDTTFATPAPPVATPVLKARANFSWGFIGSRTVLTRIRVTDLSGGETIKITCSGKRKGCPLKSKTYKNVKKGTRTLTTLFGNKRKLKTGAKIVVTISKPGAIGSTATVTIGKRKKDPKIVRRQLTP